jgi:hypothetical protein
MDNYSSVTRNLAKSFSKCYEEEEEEAHAIANHLELHNNE